LVGPYVRCACLIALGETGRWSLIAETTKGPFI
jgi:hypothetical protein